MSNKKYYFSYDCQARRKHRIDIFAKLGQKDACVKKHGRLTRLQIKGGFVNGKFSKLTGENGKGIQTGSIGSGSRIRVNRTRKRMKNLPNEVKNVV